MASRNIIPFNNKPAAVTRGTGTYTCPAGYYARVTWVLSVEARGIITGAPASSSNSSTLTTSSCDSTTGYFWVAAGDTVSGTLSNASGTATAAASNFGTGSATTTAQVNLNGSAAGIIRCNATFSSQNSGISTVTCTFSGGSSFHYMAEEYLEIT